VTPAELGDLHRVPFWALVALLRTPGVSLGGLCVVDHMEGLGLGILTLVGSDRNRLTGRTLQAVLPLRQRGMHVLRQPVFFFFLLWLVAKVGMSRKIRDRLRVYGTNTAALVQALGADAAPVAFGGAAVTGPDATVVAASRDIADTPWLKAP